MMLNLPDISQAFNGNTNEQILDSLQKYRKELNFLLMNLDESNMPEIAGRLDGIDGSFSLIQQDLSSITLAVGNAQGDISALSLRADGIDLAVSNNAGSISALSLTVDGISTTVSNQAGQISTINQTVSGIQTTVSSHTTTIGTHTSQITQLDSEISSVVSWTDVTGNMVASLINQTATTITLQASKIDLTGITTIYGSSAGDYVTVNSGMMSFFDSYNEVFRILPTTVGAALYNPSGTVVAVYEDLRAMYNLIVDGSIDVSTGDIDVNNLYVGNLLYVGSDRVVTTDGDLHIDTTTYGINIQKSGYSTISILWGASLP